MAVTRTDDRADGGGTSAAQERWRRVEALFTEVVDLAPDARAAHLARASDDAALVAEVLDLVAVSTSAPEALRDIVAREAGRLARPATGVEIGERLDGHVIVGELGEGGMGIVYLAEPVGGGARVAIKVLTQLGGDALARFRDERHILAGLDHPGIVRLLDGGRTATGLPYLVMQHIDGVPLTRFARERGLDAEARIALFLQVCAAVEHAHEKQVVHRDLKPSNVLVGADGTAHLLDFGIAKLLDAEGAGRLEARTRTGMPLFTPEYASPEQTRGGPVSTASDVYSLGAVLYELLTGATPIATRGDPLDVLRAIRETRPRPPSEVAPAPRSRASSRDLDDIVMKALEKEPARRYTSVAALAGDLRRHLVGEPVHARSGPGTRALRWLARPRVAVPLALAAVAAATLVLLTRGPADVAPARPVSAPPPAATDPAPALVGRAEIDALAPTATVLSDPEGGIYVVDAGAKPRVFYGAPAWGRLYAQPTGHYLHDASSGRWTISVWAPRVPGLEPGDIARKEDGSYVRWCGGARETPLTPLGPDEARAVFARSTFVGPAHVRTAYLLARDDAGRYYYVDAVRDEHGGGRHRVFVGALGAMQERPLTAVALDRAGDVFATADGELRIVRHLHDGAPPTVTWIQGSQVITLAHLEPSANLRLIYRDLGIYGLLGTVCDDL